MIHKEHLFPLKWGKVRFSDGFYMTIVTGQAISPIYLHKVDSHIFWNIINL